MTAVGFAGLGRMGVPMARNILRAGNELTVWNRTRERCVPLEQDGARVADTPAALARGVDVLVTMVADAAAAEAVLRGPNGALATLRPGAIVLEMSTIGPFAVRALAAATAERGCLLLDSPVSGSTALAEAAGLTAMVGGDPGAFERARPVLAAMTKAQFYLGESGAGAAMKLAVNSIIALTNEAVAEALVLAESSGIGRAAAYEVLAASAIASPFVQYKQAAFLDPDGAPVGFTTALMQKDLALALELAREHGVSMPATAAAYEVLALARRLGFGEGDLVRVADALRLERTGSAPPPTAGSGAIRLP